MENIICRFHEQLGEGREGIEKSRPGFSSNFLSLGDFLGHTRFLEVCGDKVLPSSCRGCNEKSTFLETNSSPLKINGSGQIRATSHDDVTLEITTQVPEIRVKFRGCCESCTPVLYIHKNHHLLLLPNLDIY